MTRPRRAVDAALALGAGVVHALSFAPWPLWWLQCLSLASLLVLARRSPPTTWRQPALLGFAFGLGWFCVGIGWTYISMHDHGGMPAPLAALAVLLFAAYLALFPAGVLAALHRLRVGGLAWIVALAGCWLLAEWLRGWLFTGFPWLAIGYAHVDGPLSGWAPLLGLPGVNAGAAAIAGALALLLQRPQRRAAIIVVLAALAIGQGLRMVEWTDAHGRPIKVRLTQGNVAQSMKFDARHAYQAMRGYAAMVNQPAADGQAPDLVVLPETAWTVPWPGTPPEIVDALFPPDRPRHGQLAIGLPMTPSERSTALQPFSESAMSINIANSVLVLDRVDGRPLAQYDKHHLVPFGEFIPPGFQWFVRMMQIPLGNFTRGPVGQPPIDVDGQRVAFNICYEDLFGEELLPSIRQGATVLINVSNLGWFGDSHALPQHLAIARLRAIETGRPMLRATNTGVTASIDARGQVRAQLPTHSVGVLDDQVQGTQGLTPYVRWGNLPALVLALASIGLALIARSRKAPIR